MNWSIGVGRLYLFAFMLLHLFLLCVMYHWHGNVLWLLCVVFSEQKHATENEEKKNTINDQGQRFLDFEDML